MLKPRKYRKPKGRYLEHTVKTTVRFQEVDALGIVWHGHYLSYFEDARFGFGREYGLDYNDIVKADLIAPVVHVTCDFLIHCQMGDVIEITAMLFYSEKPTLEFYYEINRKADGKLVATGTTVQAITGSNSKLVLTRPDYLTDFYNRWQHRMVSTDESEC